MLVPSKQVNAHSCRGLDGESFVGSSRGIRVYALRCDTDIGHVLLVAGMQPHPSTRADRSAARRLYLSLAALGDAPFV